MSNKLAIILCTYNGEKFLQEQLESFAKQSFKDWHLYVYDDRSKDNTQKLVQDFNKNNQVTFTKNEVAYGFAKNFLNGIANTSGDFDFYALSDQDDIWQEEKLKRAASYLKNIEKNVPALYCSRTTLVDIKANQIGHSSLFQKRPSFTNALVQSIAGGNTMVFNKAARNLIIKAGQDLDIISHDWFIYQLISGAGGAVYYDEHSEILYRQHGNNLIGSNNGFFARLLRIKMLLNDSFRNWNDKNIKALQSNVELLTKENQAKLALFATARKKTLFPRIIGFIKCGIHRQTLLGNLGLIVGSLLNKV